MPRLLAVGVEDKRSLIKPVLSATREKGLGLDRSTSRKAWNNGGAHDGRRERAWLPLFVFQGCSPV